MAMSDRRADLRRYPRAKVTWPVILELENRSLELETVNLSPMGTKVRVDEPLEVGKTARPGNRLLRFLLELIDVLCHLPPEP